MQQDHKQRLFDSQEPDAQEARQQDAHQEHIHQEDPQQQFSLQFPEDAGPFAANDLESEISLPPVAGTAKQPSQHAVLLPEASTGPPLGHVPAQGMQLLQPSCGNLQEQLQSSSSAALSAASTSAAMLFGLQSRTPSLALTASGMFGAADSSAQLLPESRSQQVADPTAALHSSVSLSLSSTCRPQLNMPGSSSPSGHASLLATLEAQLAEAMASMLQHPDGVAAAAAAGPAVAAGPVAAAAQDASTVAPVSWSSAVTTVVAQEAAEAHTQLGSAPSVVTTVHSVTVACIGLPADAAAGAAVAAAELAAVTQPGAAAAAAAAVAHAAVFAADIALQCERDLQQPAGAVVMEVDADWMEVDGADSTWQEGYIALSISEDRSYVVSVRAGSHRATFSYVLHDGWAGS